MVLSDEVYEHILFDGRPHCGMATHPELAARSVIVSSFGKTFHVTGWRVGYCLAPAELMTELVKVHQFMMYAADTPMQVGFAHYLQTPENYLSLSAFYQQKRDRLIALMQNSRSGCCRVLVRSLCSPAMDISVTNRTVKW